MVPDDPGENAGRSGDSADRSADSTGGSADSTGGSADSTGEDAGGSTDSTGGSTDSADRSADSTGGSTDSADRSADSPGEHAGEEVENDSGRFDRLPATAEERVIERRPTRAEILSWFEDRFGIDPAVFAAHTFWEHGTGKIWVFQGDAQSPAAVEALGMLAVRTRREHWKPTLEAVQRFGDHATRNCIHLPRAEAARFLAGEDQSIDWDGDWGYLVVTHDLAGDPEPIGVGLYVYGELRSMVPKGRRRELSATDD